MAKRMTPMVLKKGSGKPTIVCPHCSAVIDRFEVVQEQHGSMDIDGASGTTYTCPSCATMTNGNCPGRAQACKNASIGVLSEKGMDREREKPFISL